jgi:FXSXX-COOH protein
VAPGLVAVTDPDPVLVDLTGVPLETLAGLDSAAGGALAESLVRLLREMDTPSEPISAFDSRVSA